MVESPLLELPIDELLAGVVESLKSRHQNLVLIAAPGAGKTTRVAPALIRAKIDQGKNQEILLLQPRQVAARSIAQRIAL